MRSKHFAILSILFLIALAAYAIQTGSVTFNTGGSSSISESSTGVLTMKSEELFFYDTGAGTTVSLPGAGVTDHGALSGLSDDDHSLYMTGYRMNSRLGITYAELTDSTTTGADANKFIDIPTDPAGNSSLGGHTTETAIHYYRPAQTVVVSKSDTDRGGEYSSIDDAINAITDSASNKRYVILVYPGTYGETVYLDKDYISIVGVDPAQCRVDNGSLGALSLSAANPGEIVGMTFMGEQGTAIVSDSSTGDVRFTRCRFWGDGTGRATAYKKTAAGTVFLSDCIWQEDGSSGAPSYSIHVEASSAVYLHLDGAKLITTKADHTFLYAPAGHTGGGRAYIYDLMVDPDLVQSVASNGLFLMAGAYNVNIYKGDFGAYGVVIHPDCAAVCAINYANVQVAYWGSPTSGLTTYPLTMAGAEYIGDVNLTGIARLLS